MYLYIYFIQNCISTVEHSQRGSHGPIGNICHHYLNNLLSTDEFIAFFGFLNWNLFQVDASHLFCHGLLLYVYSMKLLLEILFDKLDNLYDLLLFGGSNIFCLHIDYHNYHT